MTIRQLNNTADLHYITGTLIEWIKESKNERLMELSECFKRTFMYQHSIENENDKLLDLYSELRSNKNRAVLRARKAEEKIEELTKEVDKLKKQLKIFTGE